MGNCQHEGTVKHHSARADPGLDDTEDFYVTPEHGAALDPMGFKGMFKGRKKSQIPVEHTSCPLPPTPPPGSHDGLCTVRETEVDFAMSPPRPEPMKSALASDVLRVSTEYSSDHVSEIPEMPKICIRLQGVEGGVIEEVVGQKESLGKVVCRALKIELDDIKHVMLDNTELQKSQTIQANAIRDDDLLVVL